MDEIQKKDLLLPIEVPSEEDKKVSISLGAITYHPSVVLFDSKATIEYVNNKMAPFLSEDYVVTEKTADTAKKDGQYFGKIITSLETLRKDIKKKMTEQYDKEIAPEFAKIIDPIQKAREKINSFIDKFEEKELEKVHEYIKSTWASFNFDKVSLDKIFIPQWLNKATSKKSIKEDMQRIISEISMSIADISLMPNSEAIMGKYLVSLDKDLAIREATLELEALNKAKNIPTPQIVQPVVDTEEEDDLPIPQFTKEQTLELRTNMERNFLTIRFMVTPSQEKVLLDTINNLGLFYNIVTKQ